VAESGGAGGSCVYSRCENWVSTLAGKLFNYGENIGHWSYGFHGRPFGQTIGR
jgi:hypothetical protein